jgi:hypothetical protein
VLDLLGVVRIRLLADFRLDHSQQAGWALFAAETTAQQHADAVARADVMYAPFEDSEGFVVDPDAPATDVSASNRAAIAAFLETHHVPTAGLLGGTVLDAVNKIKRRAQLRGWLRDLDFVENMDTVTVSQIPMQRRQAIATKLATVGVDVSGVTGGMTIREALAHILAQDGRWPAWRAEALR